MWISSDLFSRKNELIYELFEVFVFGDRMSDY